MDLSCLCLDQNKARVHATEQRRISRTLYILISFSIPKSHRLPGSYSLLPETQHHSDATRTLWCQSDKPTTRRAWAWRGTIKKKMFLLKPSRNDLVEHEGYVLQGVVLELKAYHSFVTIVNEIQIKLKFLHRWINFTVNRLCTPECFMTNLCPLPY